jgi:bacterioferritin
MVSNIRRIERYLAKTAAGALTLNMPDTKAAEMSENVDGVLSMLHQAYASEWLAYYQYWLGAKVARGDMRATIAAELEAHAAEELAHAQILADRIMELGDIPGLSPADWESVSPCAFAPPTDRNIRAVVEQNLEAERCAIDLYKSILAETRDTDEVTYDIILKIVHDEQEHETDLRKFVEDFRVGG